MRKQKNNSFVAAAEIRIRNIREKKKRRRSWRRWKDGFWTSPLPGSCLSKTRVWGEREGELEWGVGVEAGKREVEEEEVAKERPAVVR